MFSMVLFMMFIQAMPGREAQAPWAMDVPYTTKGFSSETGMKLMEALSFTPISRKETEL